MYGVALTVAACLRSGTRADVAWLVAAEGVRVDDWSEAEVLTPGGGRSGSLLGGALDGALADRAGFGSVGRLVEVEITEVDALIAGLPGPGSVECLLVPADAIPAEVWDLAAARQPICLVTRIDGGEVVEIELFTTSTIGDAGAAIEQVFSQATSRSVVIEGRVVSVFMAVPQLVVVGATAIAEALAEVAATLGWRTRTVTEATAATGIIATLSPLDKVVVTGHDLDLTGAALLAALDSGVGYIGALGARRMQENRADWLAYRGVTDLSRIHGPAGLDIGAETPAEIAIAILAEAIADGAGSAVESTASPG